MKTQNPYRNKLYAYSINVVCFISVMKLARISLFFYNFNKIRLNVIKNILLCLSLLFLLKISCPLGLFSVVYIYMPLDNINL